MITFLPHEGLDCPVVLCDACLEPIGQNGWVLWCWEADDPGRIWHVHQGWCDHQITWLHKAVGLHPFSRELDLFLGNLAYNTTNPLPVRRTVR